MNTMSSQSQSTWYSLREFETRDVTSRAYHGRHALTLSAAKAREIASSFIQAREYFRSASQADFAVRPLLLYYGAASLARGLTLFLTHEKRETSLKQGHGLQIVDWNQPLSSGITEIGNLRIRLTQRLFHDLLTATGNRFYFRHNGAAVNWSIGATIPKIGSEMTLSDIVARVPDVSLQYKAWTNKSIPFLPMQALDIDREGGTHTFTVVADGEETLNLAFPEHMFSNRDVQKDGTNFTVTCNTIDGIFFAQRASFLGMSSIVLCEPMSDKSYFSPLAACFMTSYVLGMLCRYFPTSWTDLSRTEKGDAFLPLATRLLDWIDEVFPQMVVDVLRGPYSFEKG